MNTIMYDVEFFDESDNTTETSSFDETNFWGWVASLFA